MHMQKLFSLLLALTLAFSCVSGLADALPAENAMPQTGDVVHGFELLETRDFPLVGGEIYYFEHQKTGAKLVFISNEDTNRVFQLSFPTRPIDQGGLPHIFEHATLFGSDKYPSKSLFFNISYQTYNTYMNAYTQDIITSFPLASLSEEQLLALADFYTDSCLHPMIMTDESIYRTQAWHYNLPDMDSPLTYEGVVYSEMQGALTLPSMALENANSVTFPGSALSYCYGGMPSAIPDVTWEDVKNYHDTFYHPSNCIALLYGHMENYEAFLELLDGYFAEYEKKEITYTDDGYERITAPVVSSVPYPVAAGSDPTNQSVIYYYIVLPDIKGNTELEYQLDNMCSLLRLNSSVLVQNFRKAFPAGSISVGRELAGPDDAIVFVASGMNENDAEQVKAIADDALKNVMENGFPQDMVDSAVASINISNKMISEGTDAVDGIVSSYMYYFVAYNNPFAYPEMIANMEKIDEENQQGLYKQTASLVSSAELYTLTTTYPLPGAKEEEDAALAAKMAEIKAGMSTEELEAIIAETNAAPADEDTSAYMAQLKPVDVETLPEEIRTYAYQDVTGEDGIRRIDVTAGVDGIGYVELNLDAGALPQEDIHWMRLFTRLLGQLDTESHTKEELDVLITRYLYNKAIGINAVEQADSVHPYLILSWNAMDEDLSAGYDLMEELVFHTRFDDPQKLAEQIQAQKTSVRGTINSNPYSIMIYRGLGDKYPYYRFISYTNFLEYYSFLENLEVQITENPESVMEHLKALQSFFANQAGAVSAFAGNENSIAVNRPLADAFLAKLPCEEREAAVYDLPAASQKEALIVDSNVQFNNIIATIDDLGLEEVDAGLAAITGLVSDRLLVPILRDQMGVYTPLNSAIPDDGGMYLVSYRDPNLRETFDVYASLPEAIRTLEVTQDDLDGYIMSTYSGLCKPDGELTGAVATISDLLNGKDLQRRGTYMKQLKAVTTETLKNAADLYEKAFNNGVHSTAGSAAAINANADLFDSILNPFNAKDTSQVVFTDAAEGSELYDVVRFVYENGLMAPAAEDLFGVDATATAGDFYGAMYVLATGTTASMDEAIAFFTGYGMVPEGVDAATELTVADNASLFSGVTAALGAPFTPEVEEGTENAMLTRGQMASILSAFYAYVTGAQ